MPAPGTSVSRYEDIRRGAGIRKRWLPASRHFGLGSFPGLKVSLKPRGFAAKTDRTRNSIHAAAEKIAAGRRKGWLVQIELTDGPVISSSSESSRQATQDEASPISVPQNEHIMTVSLASILVRPCCDTWIACISSLYGRDEFPIRVYPCN
jgi:hypothetical protein